VSTATIRILLLLSLGAVGCGGEITPRGDAGPVSDAGAPVDAWRALDDAGPLDASPVDAGTLEDAGAPSDAGPPDAGPTGPILYPVGERHSPMTLELADALRTRAAATPDRRDDVFAKVGDSITVSTAFLACFVAGPVDLGGRDALQASLEHFRAGDAAGTDPFRRVSTAAGVGWSASRVLMGTPSPLDTELSALRPRFASLMYGTNDVGFVDLDSYGRNMTSIVDAMLAGGTLPILSSIPPRDDDATADDRVPVFNALVRALAQSRGVPFVDYHRELLPLPDHGLSTADGVHPRSSMGGCVLTPAGLQAGSNVRNLLVLEALDRLRRVVVIGEDALDATAPRLAGSGTRADPFVVPSLPFSGRGDTRTQGEAAIDRWDACSAANESGRELRFRFRLDAPRRVTAAVSSGAGADVDVHVVRAGGGAADCVARDNRSVDVDLAAGDWELVADTFASASGPLPGEVLVAIVPR
jgi:lysophospholipase L1-like esterase